MADLRTEAQKRAEAEAFARDYLSNLPTSPTATPEAPASPYIELDPPPAPPSKLQQGATSGIKRGLIQAGAGIVGGPVGGAVAGLAMQDAPPKPPAAPTPMPDLPPAGPPTPPGNEDAPMILDSRRPGVGAMVSPAGMYPHSMTTQAHRGRGVPDAAKGAFGASTALQLEGAERQAAADKTLHQQIATQQQDMIRANEDAAVKHARIKAEKDAVVKQRMAAIEATNAEAAAAIDPGKYWHDRGAFATILGAVAVGLGEYSSKINGGPNTALHIFENGINREVQAQLTNRQNKAKQGASQERLLDLHLERLQDDDKAVDATKMGLWQNVGLQLEAYKAQHGASVSDAHLAELQAGILEKYGEIANKMHLQETDDVNQSYTEQYRPATYAAGAGGTPAGKMEGYELVPVPGSDQTSEKGQMIAVPKDAHERLAKVVGFSNAVVGINQDALARVQEIKSDWEKAKGGDTNAMSRINANRKTLADLAQRKAALTSTAEAQGVLKEEEFDRAMSDRTHFTDWWKPGSNIEKRIQAQNNGLVGAAAKQVQGAGGQHVKMAYTRDKNGALQPTPLFTGRMYAPSPVAPELEQEKK